MTLLEKALAVHPNFSTKYILDNRCPSGLGLVENIDCDVATALEENRCIECWNREYKEPNEPKEPCKETTGTVEHDPVNHPSHYTTGMECIEEIIRVFGKEVAAHFCLGNVWKYRKRALHKNGLEDLDKSDWYMEKYCELMREVAMFNGN